MHKSRRRQRSSDSTCPVLPVIRLFSLRLHRNLVFSIASSNAMLPRWQLTIWLGPNSIARFLVTEIAAALEPQYHVNPGRPMMPAVDATVTTAAGPPLSRVLRSAGTMTCTEWKIDLRFTSLTLSKSASVVSRTGLEAYVAPALLMTKLTPPNAAFVSARRFSHAARFVTSPVGQRDASLGRTVYR